MAGGTGRTGIQEHLLPSLDIASTQLWHEGRYRLGLEKRELSSDEFTGMLLRWLKRYPVCAIEDPVAETESAAMAAFTQAAKGLMVIGDDFLVTNAGRIREAARIGACNAALVSLAKGSNGTMAGPMIAQTANITKRAKEKAVTGFSRKT